VSKLKKPRAIHVGDTIGIAAPAGPVDPALIEAGEVWLRGQGFEPYRRGDLLARRGYLAGEDLRRADELMRLVEDPDVSAILCARGGYGCHRIVSMLDANLVRRRAKALVGYSDITTLLLWQRRCAGLLGFHGPMLERDPAEYAEASEGLLAALSGSTAALGMQGQGVVGGTDEGRLTGGSLSLVVASLSTPWEIDTRDSILLLEEVHESPYRVDRMLQQLAAAGKLEGVRGIGIGSMVGCEDERHPIPSAAQVLDEILGRLGVPMVVDLPFGHGELNQTWAHGARASIDGDRGEIALLESVVSGR
jgi:muramoyltetrapeptide carboxypeptidase